MSITGKRPETVSKALWEIADWLDEADRLIDRLASARGIERTNSGDDVQKDLRRLSRWFHEQPECDAHASAYLAHFDAADACREHQWVEMANTVGDEWVECSSCGETVEEAE